jgi:PAS domain S-box-containing protein
MKRSQNRDGAQIGRFRQAWARACPISALLWMLVITVAAAAEQSKDVMELGPEELKSVQVYSASMYLQSDREAPSSVTVITADQIRRFGYRTLADALRSVRGFDVTYDRNYSYVGVRGFARPGGYNDQVLLLINGYRLNDNVYDSAQLGAEFPLDVDLIERIEIVRGPSFNEMLGEIESAEAALRAAHRESELFINSVPSILIGTDSVGQITRWNLAAATTFGLPAAAVLGKPLQHCEVHWVHPQLDGEVNSWFHVEKSEKRENVMFERDGRRRFLGLSIINADLFTGGKGTGFLITGADITERKILEEQLRQAQKLEAIGQLAAGIKHEINTPAQFVGDNTKFLQETWPLVDKILGLCLRLGEQSLGGSAAAEVIAELVQCTQQADPAYLLQEVPQAIAQALDGVGRISKIVRAMKEFPIPALKVNAQSTSTTRSKPQSLYPVTNGNTWPMYRRVLRAIYLPYAVWQVSSIRSF